MRSRPVPGSDQPEAELTVQERAHVAALMRVNHCGEICAQALYQGQALGSRAQNIRQALEQAGREETEHLAWTERRIEALGGRKSLLNPLWYAGALGMGVLASRCGDAWSLGFLAETERQVDEASHAETALRLGARELPLPIKTAMRLAARVMTGTAYYL